MINQRTENIQYRDNLVCLNLIRKRYNNQSVPLSDGEQGGYQGPSLNKNREGGGGKKVWNLKTLADNELPTSM